MHEILKEETTDWQVKAEEYLAGWKRAMADYANREKELGREKTEIAEYAVADAAGDFLPVLDNLKQAMAHVPEDQRELGWVKGISFIVRQFEETLKAHGVTPFASLGTPFDPGRHEAVGEEEGAAPGTVTREVAAGYEMRGKVLRPAKVVVGKEPGARSQEPSGN